MKKRLLLLPLIGGLAYFTLSSNIHGYVTNNVTGSDGASLIGCGGGGCHGSAATTTLVPTILLDSAGTGTMVTKYTPGKSYVIRFGSTNTTGATLPKFGFQFSVVKASAHIDAGSMGTVAGTTTFGTGITVMVQSDPMMPTSGTGGIGTIYGVSIPWTAPVAGTGSVVMYGALNAVNNDTMATASDKWNTKNTTFAERTASEVETITTNNGINVYPNPVVGNLSLQLNNVSSGTYTVHVFDLTGKLVVSQEFDVNGSANATVDMHTCVPGIYQVAIGKDGVNKVVSVTKQ